MVDVATKLPNLEHLGIEAGGYEWYNTIPEDEVAKHYQHDWEGPSRDGRHDFAGAVSSCKPQLPSQLERASLDFLNRLENALDIHHGEDLSNLVSPAQKDPFSSSLGILCNNLRHLRLRAVT